MPALYRVPPAPLFGDGGGVSAGGSPSAGAGPPLLVPAQGGRPERGADAVGTAAPSLLLVAVTFSVFLD